MKFAVKISFLVLAALSAPGFGKICGQSIPDSITASEALIKMPANTLDILTSPMRRDLIDYYRADSIRSIPNTMEGLSQLERPLTRDYLRVRLTPVTTLTLRVLKRGKKEIVASAYTIGDSLQAADTDLRFYTAAMTELQRDKIIRLAETADFLQLEGVDKAKRKELMEMIPFPTVEYVLSPDGTGLTATLTSGEFLGRETLEKLKPYLRRVREYKWTGKRYDMVK